MVTMPDTYAPYTDTRRVELSFTFGVVAPDAAALATPNASGNSSVSQSKQSVDAVEEMSGDYTSLEKNMWVLDGSKALYPSPVSSVQTGWNSDAISGDDGAYASPPWLEFSFPSNQDSFGFTLLFDNTQPDNHPAQVVTTVWDESGDQIGTVTTEPDSYFHVVSLPTQNYRRVRFTFNSSSIPHRRVRVCGIRFGIKYDYDVGSISGVEVRQSVSPWAESLPSAEVDATIDNSDQLYNMVNPSGLYAYLQDGQYMQWILTVNGQDVHMGQAYFTNAESEDGGLTASITFNDWLYALDNVEYTGAGTGTWTLQQAVTALLAAASAEFTAVYEDGLAAVEIANTVPQGTSIRESLRLCAQAAMCTCYVDRNNALHFFRPVLADQVDEWSRDVQHGDAQVKVGQMYNAVKLTASVDAAGEDLVYYAKNIATGDMERMYEVSNPCVTAAMGNQVAAWILSWVQRRVSYEATVRGNPAVDLLDTVQINDVYGVNGEAVVTQLNYSYDGGLTCDAAAIR